MRRCRMAGEIGLDRSLRRNVSFFIGGSSKTNFHTTLSDGRAGAEIILTSVEGLQ